MQIRPNCIKTVYSLKNIVFIRAVCVHDLIFMTTKCIKIEAILSENTIQIVISDNKTTASYTKFSTFALEFCKLWEESWQLIMDKSESVLR